MINKPVIIKYQEDLDTKYPNRHREIHKACCKHCPTKVDKRNGIIDPEVEEYKNYPKELLATELVFVCAWRQNKLCKGICDEYGIDEKFINECLSNINQQQPRQER